MSVSTLGNWLAGSAAVMTSYDYYGLGLERLLGLYFAAGALKGSGGFRS